MLLVWLLRVFLPFDLIVLSVEQKKVGRRARGKSRLQLEENVNSRFLFVLAFQFGWAVLKLFVVLVGFFVVLDVDVGLLLFDSDDDGVRFTPREGEGRAAG